MSASAAAHPQQLTRTRSALRFGRQLAVIAAALAVTGLAACGDDDDGPTGGGGGITGRYNIASVSGPNGTDDSAPFVLLEGVLEGVTFRAEIVSGYLDLASNGTYTSDAETRFLVNGEEEDVGGDDLAQSGTYTVSGNSITFTPDDDDEEFTATRNGDALTFSQEIDLDDDGPAAPQTITIIARK